MLLNLFSRFRAACGRKPVALLLGLAFAWSLALPAAAQLPAARMFSIHPPGGKQGTTFQVAISGPDLDDARQLHFADPAITAEPVIHEAGLGQIGPQVAPNLFTVTIKPEARPGLYEARAVGKYGISSPRAFVVGSDPELREVEPNNSLKTAMEVPLGTIVNGRSDGGADLDYFKFGAKAGQRVIIDCWAMRIDSRMDATLVLYDAAGRELASNRDTNRRDPLLDFTVPKDGEYVVQLHDFLYGGSEEYFYRLSIGVGPYLDFVFPPSGLPGSQNQYTLYGRNLPGGQPAGNVAVNGNPLEALTVTIAVPADKAQDLIWDSTVEPAESGIDAIEYRLNSPQGLSNPLLLSVAGARWWSSRSRTTIRPTHSRSRCLASTSVNSIRAATRTGSRLRPSRETFTGSKSFRSGWVCRPIRSCWCNKSKQTTRAPCRRPICKAPTTARPISALRFTTPRATIRYTASPLRPTAVIGSWCAIFTARRGPIRARCIACRFDRRSRIFGWSPCLVSRLTIPIPIKCSPRSGVRCCARAVRN